MARAVQATTPVITTPAHRPAENVIIAGWVVSGRRTTNTRVADATASSMMSASTSRRSPRGKWSRSSNHNSGRMRRTTPTGIRSTRAPGPNGPTGGFTSAATRKPACTRASASRVLPYRRVDRHASPRRAACSTTTAATAAAIAPYAEEKIARARTPLGIATWATTSATALRARSPSGARDGLGRAASRAPTAPGREAGAAWGIRFMERSVGEPRLVPAGDLCMAQWDLSAGTERRFSPIGPGWAFRPEDLGLGGGWPLADPISNGSAVTDTDLARTPTGTDADLHRHRPRGPDGITRSGDGAAPRRPRRSGRTPRAPRRFARGGPSP